MIRVSRQVVCDRRFPARLSEGAAPGIALCLIASRRRDAIHLEQLARETAGLGHPTTIWRPVFDVSCPLPDAVDLADAIATECRIGWSDPGDPALFVGHRAGFHVAVELARRHPSRVAGLAALCASAVRRGAWQDRCSSRAADLARWSVSALSRRAEVPDLDRTRPVLDRLVEWSVERASAVGDVADALADLTIPLLVLTNGLTRRGSESARLLARQAPMARWETLPHDCTGSKVVSVSVARRLVEYARDVETASSDR